MIMGLVCEWNSCNQSYSDAGKLYHHLSESHCSEQDENATDWPCHWKGCNVSVDRKYRLTSHLLTHTPYRPYCCSFCKKTFKRSHDMKKHIRLSHPSNIDDTMSTGSDSLSMDESLESQFSQRHNMMNAMQMQQMQQMQQQMQQQGPQQPSGIPLNHVALQRNQFAQGSRSVPVVRNSQEQSPESTRNVRLGSISDPKYESLVQKFMAYTPPAR